MFARTARAFARARPVASRAFSVAATPKARVATVFTAGAAFLAYNAVTQKDVITQGKSIAGVKGGVERSFIMIKPDGVQRGLISEIISRFEKRGYKLVAMKLVSPTKALAEQHYADLKARPFFGALVDYITNGKAPVVAMVWEGKDVIRQGRRLIGATNPLESAPGTIRGDLAISIGRNIIHGSDSFETAEQEIALWFTPKEVNEWTATVGDWVNADN